MERLRTLRGDVTRIGLHPGLFYTFSIVFTCRGVARIFQRGGHTGSNNIVMAFSPRNIVGCLLKKRLTKGAHQDRPSYALDLGVIVKEIAAIKKCKIFGWK